MTIEDQNGQEEVLTPVIPKNWLDNVQDINEMLNEWCPENTLVNILKDDEIAAYLATSIYLGKLGKTTIVDNDLKYIVRYALSTMKLVFDYGSDAEKTSQINMLEEYSKNIIEPTNEDEYSEISKPDIPVENKIPTARTQSKLARAKVIYQNNKSLTRKEIVALFISELGMAPPSASVYYSLVQK